jgi:hypothetical protein
MRDCVKATENCTKSSLRARSSFCSAQMAAELKSIAADDEVACLASRLLYSHSRSAGGALGKILGEQSMPVRGCPERAAREKLDEKGRSDHPGACAVETPQPLQTSDAATGGTAG